MDKGDERAHTVRPERGRANPETRSEGRVGVVGTKLCLDVHLHSQPFPQCQDRELGESIIGSL